MNTAFKLYSIAAQGSVHTYLVYTFFSVPNTLSPSSEHKKGDEANINSI